MNRLPTLAAILGATVMLGAVAFLPASGTPSATSATTPTPSTEPTKKTLPANKFTVGDLSAEDVLPVPSPVATWTPPAGYTGTLKPEDWVQITGTDSCLNVRVSPGLVWPNVDGEQPIQTLNCLPDGFVGQLSYGPNTAKDAYQSMPTQADGYWWWYVLGQGWVAENWLTVTQAPSNARPELADAGLIAFVREDGVHVMNADGSDERLLYAVEPETYASSLRWFPDGESLVIGTYSWIAAETVYATNIVSVDGAVLREFAGLTEGAASPSGTHLAATRVQKPGELGGFKGTPVVIDLTTGTETAVGPEDWSLRGPEWSPDSSMAAYPCRRSWWEELQPDGSVVRHEFDCAQGDGLVGANIDDGSARLIIPFAPDAFYMNPSWSPDGSTIAMFSSGGACFGYVLFDVATGSATRCLEMSQDAFGGRCGGNAETGASDWTPDGRTLAYHWQSGEGLNGVALVDIATSERRVIPTTGSSSISFTSDGAHLSYESAGYVWTADVDGSDVARVTDGSLPAWQPRP